jgi:hypothetical protein
MRPKVKAFFDGNLMLMKKSSSQYFSSYFSTANSDFSKRNKEKGQARELVLFLSSKAIKL